MPTQLDICNQALIDIGVRDLIASLTDASEEAELCAVLLPQTLDKVNAEFWWPFTFKRAAAALVASPAPGWQAATVYGINAQVTLAGTPGYFVSLVANNVGNAPSVNGSSQWAYFGSYGRQGWNYMYALPADCIEVRGVQYQLADGILGPFPTVPPTPPPWWLRQQYPDRKTEWKVEADDASDGGNFLLTNMTAAEVHYTMSLVSNQVANFPPLFSEAVSWRLAMHLAMGLPNKADYAKGAAAAYELSLSRAIARALNSGEVQHEPRSEFVTRRH